jgi:hypothetical protein
LSDRVAKAGERNSRGRLDIYSFGVKKHVHGSLGRRVIGHENIAAALGKSIVDSSAEAIRRRPVRELIGPDLTGFKAEICGCLADEGSLSEPP